MKQEELVIRTNVYQTKIQNGKDVGLLEFVRRHTYGELKAQFESLLKAIHIPDWECSAYDGIEYISLGEYRKVESRPVPRGTTLAFARRGQNEGYRVEIAIVDADGYHHTILSAKYLTDLDNVWAIAKEVDRALWDGLFGS